MDTFDFGGWDSIYAWLAALMVLCDDIYLPW